jgi:hypothetical protein
VDVPAADPFVREQGQLGLEGEPGVRELPRGGRAGGPFSTYSDTGLPAVRPPCRTTSEPPTLSCPGDPWGAAQAPPLSPRCFPSEEPGGCWCSASVRAPRRGRTWIAHAWGSGTL